MHIVRTQLRGEGGLTQCVRSLFKLSTSIVLLRTREGQKSENFCLRTMCMTPFVNVRDIQESQTQLMEDLDKITSWARQWKMEFNPDISKQAIEVIFSHKKKKPVHPPLHFNGIPVKRETHTQHLGVILDQRLSFRLHIEEKIKKANKGLGLLRFLSKYITRPVLDKIYKMYVRPHLDYGDIIYHNQLQDSMQLLESVQYQAGLVVTGC